MFMCALEKEGIMKKETEIDFKNKTQPLKITQSHKDIKLSVVDEIKTDLNLKEPTNIEKLNDTNRIDNIIRRETTEDRKIDIGMIEPNFETNVESELSNGLNLDENDTKQDLFLGQLGIEPKEQDHPRRPGLRKLPQSRKSVESNVILSAEPKKRGPRGSHKRKRGRRGRPKMKRNAEMVKEGSELNLDEQIDLDDELSMTKSRIKKKKQSQNEVRAIEKDATKELMEALMRSAILKGKVASIQPSVKKKSVNTNIVKKKILQKSPQSESEDEDDVENSIGVTMPDQEDDDNTSPEGGEFAKSSHTPRYKYLTGFEDRPYSCPYCQGRFTKKSYLKQHVRTHTGEKPHQCEVCHRRFRQQAALKRHIMTHTGEKPFECDRCNKRYSDKAVLNEHLRTHTGEKPFLCHVCTKAFAYTFSFKQHMKRHRGERDHHCNLCDAKFYTASSLATHVKKSHTGIRDAVCDICGKAFVDKSDLSRHRRKIHAGTSSNNMVGANLANQQKNVNNIPVPANNNPSVAPTPSNFRYT